MASKVSEINQILRIRGLENKELMNNRKNIYAVLQKYMKDHKINKLHGLAGVFTASLTAKATEPEFSSEVIAEALQTYCDATKQRLPVQQITAWIIAQKKRLTKTDVGFSFALDDPMAVAQFEAEAALQVQRAIAANQAIDRPVEQIFPTEQLRRARTMGAAASQQAAEQAAQQQASGRGTRASARRSGTGNDEPVPM